MYSGWLNGQKKTVSIQRRGRFASTQSGAAPRTGRAQLSLSFTKTCNILWQAQPRRVLSVIWFENCLKTRHSSASFFGASQIVNETFAVIWQRERERESEKGSAHVERANACAHNKRRRERRSELLLCAPSTTMRRCQLRIKRGQAMPSTLTAWEPVCERVCEYQSVYKCVCVCVCACTCVCWCVCLGTYHLALLLWLRRPAAQRTANEIDSIWKFAM